MYEARISHLFLYIVIFRLIVSVPVVSAKVCKKFYLCLQFFVAFSLFLDFMFSRNLLICMDCRFSPYIRVIRKFMCSR